MPMRVRVRREVRVRYMSEARVFSPHLLCIIPDDFLQGPHHGDFAQDTAAVRGKIVSKGSDSDSNPRIRKEEEREREGERGRGEE